MCVSPTWSSKRPPSLGQIKGIADGGEDACFAEARAGGGEIVVAELQTFPGADSCRTRNSSTPATNEIRTIHRARRSARAPPERRRWGLPVGRDDRRPHGVHPVAKMTFSTMLPSAWVSFVVSLMSTASRWIEVQMHRRGKELPTPKKRSVGAGTKMVPVRTLG